MYKQGKVSELLNFSFCKKNTTSQTWQIFTNNITATSCVVWDHISWAILLFIWGDIKGIIKVLHYHQVSGHTSDDTKKGYSISNIYQLINNEKALGI